jgi:hypothetical protein
MYKINIFIGLFLFISSGIVSQPTFSKDVAPIVFKHCSRLPPTRRDRPDETDKL